MFEGIAIALMGGMISAVPAFVIGHFCGWQARKRKSKEYFKRKRLAEQKRAAQPKREVYDFTHDETMKFPCVEDER